MDRDLEIVWTFLIGPWVMRGFSQMMRVPWGMNRAANAPLPLPGQSRISSAPLSSAKADRNSEEQYVPTADVGHLSS